MNMPDKNQKFDEAFRKATLDYEESPPTNVWVNVRKILVLKKLLGMGLIKSYQLKLFYLLAGFLTISAIVVMSLTKHDHFTGKNHNYVSQKNTAISKQTPAEITTHLPANQSVKNIPGKVNTLKHDPVIENNSNNNFKKKETHSQKSKPANKIDKTEIPDEPKAEQKLIPVVNNTVKNEVINNPDLPDNKSSLASQEKKPDLVLKPIDSSVKKQEKPANNSQKNVASASLKPKKKSSDFTFKADLLFTSCLSPIKYFNPDSIPAKNYMSSRKNSEKTGFSYSAAIIPSVAYSHFTFSTGLIYNNNRTMVSLDNPWQKFDSISFNKIDSTWVPDSMGGHFHYDTSLVYKRDTTNGINHLKSGFSYKYLEIPFLVGYELEKGNWILRISTGISVGFFLSSKGETVNNDGKSLIPYNNFPFNKHPLHFLFMLGSEYKLNDKIGLMCGFSYKYQINKVFIEPILLNQRYSNLGILFGATYHFQP